MGIQATVSLTWVKALCNPNLVFFKKNINFKGQNALLDKSIEKIINIRNVSAINDLNLRFQTELLEKG
jgi:hypothetical protein